MSSTNISDENKTRIFSQLVTLRAKSESSFEQGFRSKKIYESISKDPEFEQLYWGRWVEDPLLVDIIISWRADDSAEVNNELCKKTLRYLSPLRVYLCPDSALNLLTLESLVGRLGLSRSSGSYFSITSFEIPTGTYMNDLAIKERTYEIFDALVYGTPRHGSHYVPPPEEEIPLSLRIGTATSHWASSWVSDAGISPANDSIEPDDGSMCKRWVTFVTWERPHLETDFKARRGRHEYLRLKRIHTSIRGLDSEDRAADGDLWRDEKKDPMRASKGFWKPITETWNARFKEHHVVFRHGAALADLHGKTREWSYYFTKYVDLFVIVGVFSLATSTYLYYIR